MKKTDLLHLRVKAHSTHDKERRQAIQQLAHLQDGDAVRTLLEIYRESHWRQNRIYVLKALGENPTHRAIEFLIDVACDTTDLGLCQEAIKSLGETDLPVAAQFLWNGFSHGPDVLKPVYALSLGSLKAVAFGDPMLEAAKKAWEEGNLLLLRNLIAAFGELKLFKSGDVILNILQGIINREAHLRNVPHGHKELARTAIYTLGHILRDERALEDVEPLFSEDSFDRALFANVLKQIGFRGQWQVEDYVIKLMESPKIHRSLPLELNGFASEDVVACFQTYGTGQEWDVLKWERFCKAIKVAHFPDPLLAYFRGLSQFPKLITKPPFFGLFLKALEWHTSPSIQMLIKDVEAYVAHSVENFQAWHEAKVLTFPLEMILEQKGLGDDLRAMTLPHAMACLQSLSYVGQWLRPHKTLLKKYGETLEELIKAPLPKDLQARIIRMAAQCKYPLVLPSSTIQLAHTDENLCKSILLLAERCPSRQMALASWEVAQNQPQLQLALVRALTTNSHLPNQAEKSIDSILNTLLLSQSDEKVLAALHYLHIRPRKSLVAVVCDKLKPGLSPAVRVAAAVALSSFKEEKTVPSLVPCLNEDFDALRGRSLDALLEISSSSATKVILNFFENHATNLELCDKIIRTLRIPFELKNKTIDVFERVIQKYPQHPLMEELVLMRDRLAVMNKITPSPESLTEENIKGLDHALSQRIAGYSHLDEAVKAALRAAEIPFLQRDVFSGDVDKSTVVLQYCKALDMAMESHFGKRILFPRFHQALHLFQNTLFKGGLVEEFPQPARVLKFFELESVFTPETLPLGKMVSLSKSIMNGKILHDHWKVVDGLKAWGIMILLFTRESQRPGAAMGLKPVVRLRSSQTAQFGARLVSLQDIRNPVAHRQTLTQYPQLEKLRADVEKTFAEFSDAFGLGIQTQSSG